MAADYPISGAQVTTAFGWESTFKTEATTIDKGFGQGQKISTYDIDNDVEHVYSLGSQDLSAQFAKKFIGGWGVEFIYSDPWFWRAILGGTPETAGGGPYTHTFSVKSPASATVGITNALPAMTINISAVTNTVSNQFLLGCVANSFNLTAAVGEPIKCKLDGFFSDFKKDTATGDTGTLVDEPLTFAQAQFDLPSGTILANVQSVDITFNRNSEGVFGLGSRMASTQLAKQREWSIRASIAYQNDIDFFNHTIQGAAAGTTVPITIPTEMATCVLTITNAGATTALRSLVITFANVMVVKQSLPIDVGEMVKMDVELRARTITSLVATDNTATFK